MSEQHSTTSNNEAEATNTKRVVDYDRLISELETAKVYMAMEEADRPALKKFLDGKPHDYHRMINHTFKLKKMTKDQALKALDDGIKEFQDKKAKAQGRRQAEEEKVKAKEAKRPKVMVSMEVQTEPMEDHSEEVEALKTQVEELESDKAILEGTNETLMAGYRAGRQNQHILRQTDRNALVKVATKLADLVKLLQTPGVLEYMEAEGVKVDLEDYTYEIPKAEIKALPDLAEDAKVEEDMRTQIKELRMRLKNQAKKEAEKK
jgi:polyhydroxyalkanoate synthesis regulator phasin